MLWQRGSFTPGQIDIVLRALPFDLSFADEDDVLVYWKGESYKTCDARYIGRDVRDCHPESSLEALESILRDFKAGTRDVVELRKEKKGRTRLTRYIAVRDDDGAYRGILEVIEDVTDL